ncbi:MAG: polysaccharide biosynthesis/export family protein [Hyphomicrobiaceae bacterium]|nr:polysaccharide biosynthesis/export family protein [Hyphomicrobiaceae bacterium]
MYVPFRGLMAARAVTSIILRRMAVYAVASLAFAVLLMSAGSADFASAADTGSEQGYMLDSGDRLRVRVHEWPGFDGDIDVGTDGKVGLPIIGRVPARGLTISKLADDIAERLRVSSSLSNPPSVVVSIVRYRPFFILGDVVTPGRYEFQPGLTVLKAVSIAGGYFRARDTASAREVISARSELATNTRLAHSALVRLARIRAEIKRQKDFKIPSELAPFIHGPDLNAVIEKERDILTANLALHQEKIATFENLSKITEREIESLRKELESVGKQLAITEKEAKRVRHLASRGLTNADRVTSVELSLSRIERTRQELQTAIIRSRLSLHREQRNAEELKQEAVKALRDEQQTTLTALNEARLLVRRSEQLLLAAEVAPPTGIRGQKKEQLVRNFTLVRRTEDGTKRLEAKPDDEVKPGDVVNVEKPVPVTGDPTAFGTSPLPSRLGAKVTDTVRR